METINRRTAIKWISFGAFTLASGAVFKGDNVESSHSQPSLRKFLSKQILLSTKLTIPIRRVPLSKKIIQTALRNGWDIAKLKSAKASFLKIASEIDLPIKVAFQCSEEKSSVTTAFIPETINSNYFVIDLNSKAPDHRIIEKMANHEKRHAKELSFFRILFRGRFYIFNRRYQGAIYLPRYASDALLFTLERATLSEGTNLSDEERQSFLAIANSRIVAFTLMEVRVWATGNKQREKDLFLFTIKQFLKRHTGDSSLTELNFNKAFNLFRSRHSISTAASNLALDLLICENYGIAEIADYLRGILNRWLNDPTIKSPHFSIDRKSYLEGLYKLFKIQWIVAEKYLKNYME